MLAIHGESSEARQYSGRSVDALWMRSGAWKGTSLNTQMGEPYGRIIIMHVTILFGGALVVMLGQPAAAVALLAVLKTLFETVSTAKKLDEHGKPVPTKAAFP